MGTSSGPRSPQPPVPGPADFDDAHTADLLERARRGDTLAWDGIYRRYRMRLLLDVRVQLRQRRIPGQGTEDIVQSAFLAAWSQIQGFEYRGEGSFRAWLRKLVVHRVLDRLRRFATEDRHRESAPEEALAAIPGNPDECPQRKVENADDVQRLLAALEELPEIERDIVVMRAFEHKRWAEIAECCERHRSYVERTYRLAFKRLARLLGESPPGPPPRSGPEDTDAARWDADGDRDGAHADGASPG